MIKYTTAILSALVLAAGARGQDHGADSVSFIDADQRKSGGPVPSATRFISGGQPDEALLEALAEEGVTLVVDFRRESEDRGIDEEQAVEGLGMSYANLPIAAPEGVNYENAQALEHLLAEHEGRVYLHCGSGNRAGAMFALREKLLGASDEDALAAGRAAGLTRLESTVRERLAAE